LRVKSVLYENHPNYNPGVGVIRPLREGLLFYLRRIDNCKRIEDLPCSKAMNDCARLGLFFGW
ncbi:MAG: hypothetical protein AAB685_02250, partial [Patescibacteria group bacterium]